MAPSAVLERILHDFQSVASQLPDSVVPREGRQRAAAELTRLGWPSARDEQWRYANLRAFERVAQFRSPAASSSEGLNLPDPLPGLERLVFVDGHRCLVGANAVATAVAPVWPAEQRLGLLCDMFASDIAALRIHGNAAIELVFITSERAAGAAVYPRIQIQLEAGSELKLVERHLGSPDRPTLVSTNASIALAHGAQLSHYRLQQCGANTLFSDTLSADVAADASYRVRQVGVGSASARTSAQVRLNGRAAAVDWQAIAVGRGEQVHDLALKVEHRARDTRTEEVFRGIAEGTAQIAFSGHIHIAEAAGGSDARQSLRGLIEGARAEIDLRPRLEINTDEVRARHGATTGQLDQNLLFYLLARGIDPKTARALLKWAFLGDVLRTIDLPALRSAAEQSAAGQLPDVAAIGALT
ncbi:MAG TPA: SufD family Fe-S cluster assembly protein [Steroidobacteraceae bacterium]|jgi:Fe-S cluster assembly protein SufD|nr:SufD family Fe-S cluster assembly protein [Steroidobacteraceae bacterium]